MRRVATATVRLPAALLLAVLALAGCSGDQQDTGASVSGPDDVELTGQSLQAAAETLLLVDEASRRGVGPELSGVVDEVRAAQTADVEALTDLLQGWDEPVPETARDHANAGHGDAEPHDELADATGAEFEEEWLDLVADQHEDALDLAERTARDGQDADAVRLARERVERLEQQLADLERLEEATSR